MKAGLLLIIALLLGSVLAHFLLAERGYVLINFMSYTLEMSVPILILVLIVLYLLVRLAIRILAAPKRLGEAAGRMRDNQARKRLNQGLIEYSQGNFLRSERLLTKGVRRAEMPLVNYLAAARAAQAQGAYERRDAWLRMAKEQSPDAGSAVLLTQAELQMAERQDDAALETLNVLLAADPKNTRALALLARLHQRNQRWTEVLAMLPNLRKRRALDADTLAALETRVHAEILQHSGREGDIALVKASWEAIPKPLRVIPEIMRSYVAALRDAGDSKAAEIAARKSLKTNWDDKLALIYGSIDADAKIQLKHAEKWLVARAENPALLLSAGRLCMRNELWGKARSYLETSIAIKPSAEAYQLYGKLMEKVGDEEAASVAYRAGLDLATESVTGGVPALEAPKMKAD
ncbi:MAG: heme biosynthesis protein HemY [Gammaproteobacteria bacterium]|nr:heme biosynthesis protein HemY [Gammaproteobacteria bacterium]